MVDCVPPLQARITVAPAGHDVALILASFRPAICTLSPIPAKTLACELLDVTGASSGDLFTLRGLTFHLSRDGLEARRVTLSTGVALTLLADLAQRVRARA